MACWRTSLIRSRLYGFLLCLYNTRLVESQRSSQTVMYVNSRHRVYRYGAGVHAFKTRRARAMKMLKYGVDTCFIMFRYARKYKNNIFSRNVNENSTYFIMSLFRRNKNRNSFIIIFVNYFAGW